MKSLKLRWRMFWQQAGARGDADGIYAHIAALYSQPRRYYHNLDHIEHCLTELEEVRHMAAYPHEVEMALWLHDAIYDTHADNNEERSANVAYHLSVAIGLSHGFADKVSSLIVATTHDTNARGLDTPLVTDIDLSSLGATPEVFEENSINILKEYFWVPEEEFKVRRAKILRGFLDRPHIYLTDFFREKYEAQARHNLKRAIEELV